MALVLFLFALTAGIARIAVLAGIYTNKLPRQIVDARTQTILAMDLILTLALGNLLADATHSTLAWMATQLICVSYLFTIAIHFAKMFKQEYKPTVGELVAYAAAQIILLLAYFIAI